MLVAEVRNVHEALPTVLAMLAQGDYTVERQSRNGPVLKFDGPFTLVYEKPCERVLFHPLRDANPFFHLYESLWMLHGANDVARVAHYVKRMETFSDDGSTLHGAYGYRWRHYFKRDQLGIIIAALKANPEDRRCVLQMWDAVEDLGRNGKDVPCNTSAMFEIDHEGRLNMTVVNRSNDIIWGATGANAVHFSFLQEYIAACVGVPVGRYWQVSNNMHAYVDTYKPLEELAVASLTWPYGMSGHPFSPTRDIKGEVEPYPLMSTDQHLWNRDLALFMGHGCVPGLSDPFFTRVVQPVVQSHAAFKKTNDPERFGKALEIIGQCQASDWRKACTEWLQRREDKASGTLR